MKQLRSPIKRLNLAALQRRKLNVDASSKMKMPNTTTHVVRMNHLKDKRNAALLLVCLCVGGLAYGVCAYHFGTAESVHYSKTGKEVHRPATEAESTESIVIMACSSAGALSSVMWWILTARKMRKLKQSTEL